jgi:hypothetical protein
LELHDLAVSKLIAGREKDLDFVGALLRHGFVTKQRIKQRLDVTKGDVQQLARSASRLAAL